MVRIRTIYTEKGGKQMTLDEWNDCLFDVLNESDELDLRDIVSGENRDRFRVCVPDGTWFELICRKAD